jgi:hypothetical protein
MKKTIIRITIIILTIALVLSATAVPAFAAEVEIPMSEERSVSNIEIVTELTNELHADNANAEEVEEVNADHDKIDFIPLYAQTDYNIPYGTYGNIASGGCGLVSVWMVATYMNDEIYDIEDLAIQFGSYHVRNAGSKWSLIKDSAEALNIDMVLSDSPNGEWYDWNMVVEALKNGQPVICLQHKGIFTGGGHFIVLTGITEDGKILVNDPNRNNWEKNAIMVEGFANGFTEQQIRAGACAYWIYAAKEEEAIVKVNVKDLVNRTSSLSNMTAK